MKYLAASVAEAVEISRILTKAVCDINVVAFSPAAMALGDVLCAIRDGIEVVNKEEKGND